MTQNEIIEMARDLAKEFGCRMCDENGDTHGEELYAMSIDDIVDTIKLVAAKATDEANARQNASWTLMCKKMVEAEREACAKACDAEFWYATKRDGSSAGVAAGNCAAAIRARGEA